MTKSSKRWQVIPAVLADGAVDFEPQLTHAWQLSRRVHIDVGDHKLIRDRIYANPRTAAALAGRNQIEVHLMVKDVMTHARQWLAVPQVHKIIVHIEAMGPGCHRVMKMISDAGRLPFIALNPTTPVEEALKCLPSAAGIMFMGVEPGQSGQKFIASVLPKIKLLRQVQKNVIIQVDGGVNLAIAKRCKEVGVNHVAVGSFLQAPRSAAARFHQLQSL